MRLGMQELASFSSLFGTWHQFVFLLGFIITEK